MLEHALEHPAAKVRDGAALGLSFLGSPEAIRCLESAVEREPIAELKDDLRQVLAELKEATRCRS